MSLAQNSRPNPIQSLLGALLYAGSNAAAGGMVPRKLLLALDELVFLPVKALGQLPVVTERARAEARSITITHHTLQMRQWPSAFEGLTVAFLTDLHCSALAPPAFLMQVVAETNRLKPDLTLLGGDCVTSGTDYVRPVAEVLSRLKAPMGVYSVLGNHDHFAAPDMIRSALRQAGVVDVNNAGHWLTRDGSRIRIAGVGDLWEDKQDFGRASRSDGGGCGHSALPQPRLCHATDRSAREAGTIGPHAWGTDPFTRRRGRGDQFELRNRFLSGLIAFETFQLYVSRGLGTVVVPLRYRRPPEIALLTLRNKN